MLCYFISPDADHCFLKSIICPSIPQLKVFDTVVSPTLKTREMERLIAGMEGSKKVLFVDDAETVNEPLCRSTANLHYINVLPAQVMFPILSEKYAALHLTWTIRLTLLSHVKLPIEDGFTILSLK